MTALAELQAQFFAALSDPSEPGSGTRELPVRGSFSTYRHAYFERIRSSLADDFPGLLEKIDSVTVTRDLLLRAHPHSWTLAEASVRVPEILREEELRRLARRDLAELRAGWREEWPEPRENRAEWIGAFGEGRVKIARTRTWEVADGRIFWRTESGVESALARDLEEVLELLEGCVIPQTMNELTERVAGIEPTFIQEFLSTGIRAGWLRFTK